MNVYKKEKLELEDILKLVKYDESSPTCLVWKKTIIREDGRRSSMKRNKPAGCVHGFLSLNFTDFKIKHIVLSLHGIIYGPEYNILFKDGNYSNFKITNLEVKIKERIVKAESLKIYKERVKTNALLKNERRLLRSARERAVKFGLEYNLDLDDIKIPEVCPILGIPLFKGNGFACANSPSLDRIDPSRGYTKNNIQVISYKANTMKNDAGAGELLNFARWVFSYFGENA